MSASALLDRLRPGIDANGSTWAILRYPQDWRAGRMTGLTLDLAESALRLAPAPLSPKLAGWYSTEAVMGAGGTLYRIDPASNRLLVKRACDVDFVPLPGFGGRGFATGRLNRPTSIAVDAHGRLYVSDTGNARVQVVLPESGEVLAVLSEGLARPVHVAIDRTGLIFVADEGTGRIHRFDARFAAVDSFDLCTLDPWSETVWTEPPEATPRAVSVLADCSIVVFDPNRTMLWHMSATGDPLPALPWPDDARLPPGWRSLPQRFVPRGEIVLGPIDGGTPRLAWHKILLDATLPPGTSLRVQSFAADRSDADILQWAPHTAVPVTGIEVRSGEGDRLVLPDQQAWSLWKAGRLLRANPVVHRFDAVPGGATAIALSYAQARRLCAGDTVTLETENGEVWNAAIVAISPGTASVSATGPSEAFLGDGPLHLVERAGRPLPYDPVDLSFLGIARSALGLAGLARDGLPQDIALPHDFAIALERGDILALGEGGYFEILDLASDDTNITFDTPLPNGLGQAQLRIATTQRRLLIQGDLPPLPAPPGAHLTVMGDVHVVSAPIAAVTGDTIWLTAPLAGQVDASNWVSAQFPIPVATDRGRYLWLRVQFDGRALPPGTGVGYALEASATPELRAIRIIAPRPNLLDFLPALYARGDLREDAPGANFMERFLSMFEGQFTRIEAAYDSVSRLLNPDAADTEWLEFVASWLDISFDPSWPIDRRRQLVREAWTLKAGQGTLRALRRYLEIYTGRPVSIGESFRRRPPPPIQLGARGALGLAPLGGASDQDDDPSLAHRFSVGVNLPSGEAQLAARSTVLKIIDTMKPAHTRFALDTRGGAAARIGMDAFIGEISIPGPDADSCACDPDIGANSTRSGNVELGFLVGGRLGRGGTPELAAIGE
ncbi:MAG: phage tail protein [Hyphomicrobium sp.]